ncbi:U3 snoRNP protein [Castilleja foliolosa]|uniref:U3 snoRNP protein n=1 Tax=Castilleja foliolosa TaxID=1961234 RepID=A0ABD3EB78_9LAMI
MTTILSKIQRLEVKVGDNNDDDDDTRPRGFKSNILEIANDDILFEIFIRIPDCRSAILCSSVSQRCHSLISNPRFIPRFVSQHHQNQAHYPLPYTIIFRKCETFGFRSALNYQPICKLFSDESMFLHGKSSYLDFLPSPMVIRASCNDLLLLTPGSAYSSVFYVCNPVTKQFYELAQNHWLSGPVKIHVEGYALVRNPEYECHFKVLLFHHPHHPLLQEGPNANTIQDVTIYCSKLGKWEFKSFEYLQPWKIVCNVFSVDIFMANGILYYLEYVEFAVDRVLALDLSKFECIIVNLPGDFGWVGSRQYHGVRVHKCIGIVGGEVRLVQVVLRKSRRRVCLKVWRLLDYSSSLWVLLHEKKYPRAPNEERFVGVFVHPVDGDKVFIVWGNHVFEYDLTKKKKKYKMMGELQEPLKFGDIFTSDRLAAIPMVHPAWPTPIPPTSFSV